VGAIKLEGITKIYPNGFKATDNISFDIADGEFMVLVGPSGCGKSTLLRMIAGLEEVTEGSIVIGDQDVTHLQPRARDIAMVFQNYALYPHMTVRDNLGFGLKLRKTPKAEIKKRVDEVSRILGLDPMLDRKPALLSGGQRQRVAMGRAMVREPKAFLMDEPLSNLDAKLRVTMRAELSRLHDRLGITTVYVTHDQVEAMTLGHRVAVLRDGVLQQVDTPQHLYNHPANLFVAAFIGSPSMNLVGATIRGDQVTFGEHTIALPAGSPMIGREGNVILGIRPSDFDVVDESNANQPRIRTRTDVVEELGSETHIIFGVDAPRIVTEATKAAADVGADDEGQLLADDQRTMFTARVDGRHHVTIGDAISLAIDNTHLHYFDPDTGLVLGDVEIEGASSAAVATR